MPPLIGPDYRLYQANISLQHWQLRNLVVAPASGWGESIIYPDSTLLTSLDLQSGRRSAITKIDTVPRCLRVMDDLIVCGSIGESGDGPAKGLLSIYNRSTQQIATHQIGSEINNCVTLMKQRSGPVESMLCNNDRFLYFGTITGAGWRLTSIMPTESPINHASVSPDGSTMVLCGDMPEILIKHRNGGRWAESLALDTGGDLGIAVDFSSNGTMFATAFQDGTCRLYDVRKLTSTPLHTVKSTRPDTLARSSSTESMSGQFHSSTLGGSIGGSMSNPRYGAFRAVKFSDPVHDLLFISEEWGRIHAVDLRDFQNHYVLMLPLKRYKYEEKKTRPDLKLQLVDHLKPSTNDFYDEFYVEQDTRGLDWSDYQGGSLIVGSGNGIAVYKCPSRNTFPTFQFR